MCDLKNAVYLFFVRSKLKHKNKCDTEIDAVDLWTK